MKKLNTPKAKLKQNPVIFMTFASKTARALKLMEFQTEAIQRPRAELFFTQHMKKHMSGQTETPNHGELSE